MSEYTFNIADYRPLSAVKTRRVYDTKAAAKKASGFVVLNSNPENHEPETIWLAFRPSIVDIRTVRETHHAVRSMEQMDGYGSRGKVIRFAAEPRVVAMPAPWTPVHDTDPSNCPPAA